MDIIYNLGLRTKEGFNEESLDIASVSIPYTNLREVKSRIIGLPSEIKNIFIKGFDSEHTEDAEEISELKWERLQKIYFAVGLDKVEEFGSHGIDTVVVGIDTVDKFINASALGAKVIGISGELCYDMKVAKKLKDSENVKTMIELNNPHGDGIKGFFVRPEDTKFYNEFVDFGSYISIGDHEVVYDIYKEREWKGELSDIVPSAKLEGIANECFLPSFGKTRANCRKRCRYENCQICTMSSDLSKLFFKEKTKE